MGHRGSAWVYMPQRGWSGEHVLIDDSLDFLYLHSLHYGDTVFEGIRAYRTADEKARHIFRLGNHLDRLWESAKAYGLWPLPFDQRTIFNACCEQLSADPTHTYIRPIIFRGPGLGVDPDPCPIYAAVLTPPWGKYLKTGWYERGEDHDRWGVKVGVGNRRRCEPDQMPTHAKGTTNYVPGGLEKQEANRREFAEMLFRAPNRDFIAEASGMNVFVVTQDGEIATPDASASILMGITRATVIELVTELFSSDIRVVERPGWIERVVIERPVLVEELFSAQEVFFTGTATEITPVTMIDGKEIGVGTDHLGLAGEITLALRDRYLEIVRGQVPAYHHWLTFVPDSQPSLSGEAATSEKHEEQLR